MVKANKSDHPKTNADFRLAAQGYARSHQITEAGAVRKLLDLKRQTEAVRDPRVSADFETLLAELKAKEQACTELIAKIVADTEERYRAYAFGKLHMSTFAEVDAIAADPKLLGTPGQPVKSGK